MTPATTDAGVYDRLARVEAKLDLLLERLRLHPRGSWVSRRTRCVVQGCKGQSQTGDPRCWRCRSGSKPKGVR